MSMSEENQPKPYRMNAATKAAQDRLRGQPAMLRDMLAPLSERTHELAALFLAHISPAELKRAKSLLKKGISPGEFQRIISAA